MSLVKNSEAQFKIEVIGPRISWFDLNLKEVWNYRDLLFMFVKRDFAAYYKQTILGPLWFFIQPLLTTIVFSVVFGKFAGISTDGMPRMLFYLAGLTIWNYFSDCFTQTANIFTVNANIFGKVYFPRLIIPLSIVVSGLIKYAVQFTLFLVFYFYWLVKGGTPIHPQPQIFLLPLLVLMMAGFAFGAGLIFSSMTTKYRDLSFLLTFGVQLLMYATPVIYPLASIPIRYQFLVRLNPLSAIVETFRFAFLGTGHFQPIDLLYSGFVLFLILLAGVVVFNKVEKRFMDTI